jgi:hypothetical protein
MFPATFDLQVFLKILFLSFCVFIRESNEFTEYCISCSCILVYLKVYVNIIVHQHHSQEQTHIPLRVGIVYF